MSGIYITNNGIVELNMLETYPRFVSLFFCRGKVMMFTDEPMDGMVLLQPSTTYS